MGVGSSPSLHEVLVWRPPLLGVDLCSKRGECSYLRLPLAAFLFGLASMASSSALAGFHLLSTHGLYASRLLICFV